MFEFLLHLLYVAIGCVTIFAVWQWLFIKQDVEGPRCSDLKIEDKENDI